MRCKKHITDISSAIGVCASCLRERLFVILAVQAQEDGRRTNSSNNTPSPLMFPRSVSPYISRRKSDTCSLDNVSHHRQQEIQFQRFFSTPQVGPSGKIVVDVDQKKKSGLRFSLFANFFSSKSKKFDSDIPGSDSGTSSRSWFGTMFSGRRRKKTRTFSMNDSSTKEQRRIFREADRCITPTRHSDEDDEHWKETPKRTPAWILPGKRRHSHNASGLGFCLSPLVRASPSRNWNQKGVPSEMIVAGDVRVVR